MTGITASNKFSTLIKEAEQIIAEDKQNEFLKAEEIRIAAELKAKQEAEAKARAEAEAKAKAEAEAKAKAEEEARVKAEAELKAKQESEVKAAAEKKKITITCVKGKLTKKVTAAKPKCPVGYKKK
jgi:membrane protein involved in colicin uptake